MKLIERPILPLMICARGAAPGSPAVQMLVVTCSLPASVVFVVHLPRKTASFITLIIHNLLSLKEDLLHQDLF